MDAAKVLGAFTAKVKYDDLPENVKVKVKTCFLNAISVGMAGAKLPQAVRARSIVKKYEGNPSYEQASLFMDGTRVSVPGAAFANTVTFHARAQEDTLATLHCGVPIVPSVLALAEDRNCSGKEILEAVLVGYEVSAAVEKGLAKAVLNRGFRTSAAINVFGIAAAACKIMKLNAGQTTEAIRIAASFAGGANESFAAGTHEWFYQVGMAARNGLTAAFLAAEGVVGAETAFTGRNGFNYTFAGEKDDSKLLIGLEGLGETYKILDATFKFYPCCAWNQLPNIMTIELATVHDIKPEEVAFIDYHMTPFEATYPGSNYKGPFTTDTQTTMSATFNIANALVNRDCTKDQMLTFDDPAVSAMFDRINVIADDSIPPICGKMSIHMNDGQVFEKEMIIARSFYNLDWDNHKAMVQRIHKEVGISENRTENLVSYVSNIENEVCVKQLYDLITEE